MERKSRRCWKYLFCFAEPDFTPRQGHQHSAFVTAEFQQASLVCRGVVGEAVGALLGAADGGLRGRLKSFHPLLALPCGHVNKTATETERNLKKGGLDGACGVKARETEIMKGQKRGLEIRVSSSLSTVLVIHHFCIHSAACSPLHTDKRNYCLKMKQVTGMHNEL